MPKKPYDRKVKTVINKFSVLILQFKKVNRNIVERHNNLPMAKKKPICGNTEINL